MDGNNKQVGWAHCWHLMYLAGKDGNGMAKYTHWVVRERETVSVIFTCPAHISKQSVFVANLGEEMKYIDSMKLSHSSF